MQPLYFLPHVTRAYDRSRPGPEPLCCWPPADWPAYLPTLRGWIATPRRATCAGLGRAACRAACWRTRRRPAACRAMWAITRTAQQWQGPFAAADGTPVRFWIGWDPTDPPQPDELCGRGCTRATASTWRRRWDAAPWLVLIRPPSGRLDRAARGSRLGRGRRVCVQFRPRIGSIGEASREVADWFFAPGFDGPEFNLERAPARPSTCWG